MKLKKAMFAAGCFWGVEETFRLVKGVVETAVGYSGGWIENPSYKDVCTDETGHAEVVLVTYNPEEIGFEDLVKIFFECHDPTQVNRQGWDVGTQYRSAIFYYTDEQREIAERIKKQYEKAKKYRKPIATEITPAKEFYRAEEYHQEFARKNPQRGCHVYIARNYLKDELKT
ncbi:MAG: peptide-methionine (S)-S-oxide reductase MsrA [Candidatus Lokiarchaeota archaeon]|nr:peptide-methionine (S)-S-oxide reductase MsrA [Candidatus Lokiarchaeota archaeon]